ncbi:MAG: hypothetical protein JSS02_08510 [Planctomycetes bacterium]|nr:hypothetical protein [Planctomycetota bacterium]
MGRNGDGKAVGKCEVKADAEHDDEAMILFVEAIADHRGGADALRCRCQGDGCCKDKNQTILGDSLGRQGGRPLSRDGYATVSSSSWR